MDRTFSVILATYKQEENLRRIMKRLEAQTCQDFEVVLADDGSHDFTVLKDTWKFPLRYVWQEDKGFRATRNKNNAIRVSEGKYLVWLEGDVLPSTGWLAGFEKLAAYDRVLCGLRPSSKDPEDPEHTIVMEDERLVDFGNNLRGVTANPWRLMSGCNCCFSRELFDLAGGCNEAYEGHGFDDWDLAARMWLKGGKITFAPEAVGFHILHPFRDSPSPNKDRFMALEKQIQYERFLKGQLPIEVVQ